ncbi:MAG: ACP S-malonyltransferase [Proteobacteria bacterium]|nr:ACP S-malonyltransferase [Pseudomonadota bacterium]
MAVAFVFPGQGSQSVGMLAALANVSPIIQSTFAEASQVLGYDLWDLCQNGPEERLNATERTQPAMLAAGVATFRLWRERGGPLPRAVAGHSLGEFSAVVVAGCMEFRDAIALVKYRGEIMQAALPAGQGAMAAVLGLEDAEIEAACREAAGAQVVETANFNSPGQVVIAGHREAVQRALEAAKARGAKRAVLLPVSAPCHTSLMREAAEKLRQRLAQAPVKPTGAIALYGVDLRVQQSAEEIRAALVKQLATAVYWSATIRALIAAGFDTFVECGPGKVLTGLNRRIDKNRDLKMLALEDPASLDQALAILGGVSA